MVVHFLRGRTRFTTGGGAVLLADVSDYEGFLVPPLHKAALHVEHGMTPTHHM